MSVLSDGATGIQLTTRIFPLAFLLFFFKTNVIIDGVVTILPWGSHYFPLALGAHQVTMSCRNFIPPTFGKNSIWVNVVSCEMTHVEYRSPFIGFMKGTLKVV